MTRLNTSFVLGYHGCEKAIGLQAVAGKLDLIQSEKAYDWLGPGVYFWEGDPLRTFEWAQSKKTLEPFVVGAVIDLRNCLDLMVRENLDLLASAYDSYVAQQRKSGLEILQNKSSRDSKSGDDKKLRFLDCAVITHLHTILDDDNRLRAVILPRWPRHLIPSAVSSRKTQKFIPAADFSRTHIRRSPSEISTVLLRFLSRENSI